MKRHLASVWPHTIDRQHYTGLPDPPRTPYPRGYNLYACVATVAGDLKDHRLHPPSPPWQRPHESPFSCVDSVHPDEWPPGATLCVDLRFYPNPPRRHRWAGEDDVEPQQDPAVAWMAGARELAEFLESLGYLTVLVERLPALQPRQPAPPPRKSSSSRRRALTVAPEPSILELTHRSVRVYRTDGSNDLGRWTAPDQPTESS
ncbi:hypothetical protein [Kitasatospora sp. NPDC088548]|uniref:hypothetical protein n=1 Tax=Kitasatospora sp. NPDC088548 TaxID=3364075 RepID=UPI0038122AE4